MDSRFVRPTLRSALDVLLYSIDKNRGLLLVHSFSFALDQLPTIYFPLVKCSSASITNTEPRQRKKKRKAELQGLTT